MSKKSRKRKLEGEEQPVDDWERENLLPDEMRGEMRSMWEIPQIFHFLHLTKEALNIGHLSMYEMERMLLMPRASRQLATIMTSLLSSPVSKAKLRKVPPMPYEFWTNILVHKMKKWFKIYDGKHRDAVKVLETIGIEPEFWNVFPDPCLLEGQSFEDLSFGQRVWLLKTVCDTVMHTRKTVQEEMAKHSPDDQSETVLGSDRYGARYIYFPQFLKSDLRIYRHSLDNKILSTVKPAKPKLKDDKVVQKKPRAEDSLRGAKAKHRRKKSHSSEDSLAGAQISVDKNEEKCPSDCKCSSDSATGSLTNEDTNLSSTSTYSNNNNHINLESMDAKRPRSLSKASDNSTTSIETDCRNSRSSGYDTSFEEDSAERFSQKMFKGFSNGSNNKCKIEIINGILNGLKSEIADERKTTNHETDISPLNDTLRNRDESIERSLDNLSSSSKTDDEKLNEIIAVEGTKLTDKNSTSGFQSGEELHQMSSTSKSDDEKLSETRTSKMETEKKLASTSKNKSRWLGTSRETKRTDGLLSRRVALDLERNLHPCSNGAHESRRDSMKLDESSSSEIVDNEAEYEEEEEDEEEEEKDMSLNDLRSLLQKEARQGDFSFKKENGAARYHLRKSRDERMYPPRLDGFNQMLTELSSSNFQLVADNVESLRDLISSFSAEGDEEDEDSFDKDSSPSCEIKLVKKLKEVLSSVEKMEPALRDSMRKARSKLQKEWANWMIGSMEDQDSSSEGGLGSNWWVLGSQGCPLSAIDDATIQTLSQPAISPSGAENHSDNRDDRGDRHPEDRKRNAEESTGDEKIAAAGQPAETADKVTRGKGETAEDGQQEADSSEEAPEPRSKEKEQESRRVLRARGVSSYTEQYLSDDEIAENELEEWTDIEAVYAAPSTQTGASTPHPPPKARHSDGRSDQEDSDQDWILPGARKRKHKRPCSSRKLKSFQQKVQSMKTEEVQEKVDVTRPLPSNAKSPKEKPRIKETKVYRSRKQAVPETSSSNSIENPGTATEDPGTASESPVVTTEKPGVTTENDSVRRVPSPETICKINSVHSELDIKDEGPIFDSVFSSCETSCSINLHQNYGNVRPEQTPVNYYVVQTHSAPHNTVHQNTIMLPPPPPPPPPPILSGYPMHQGYYVQGAPNYVVHNSAPGYIPHQPVSFHPQAPQMMAPQQFPGPPGYISYMMNPPQPTYMPPSPISRGPLVQDMQRNPMPIYTGRGSRLPQSAYLPPRQNYPLPGEQTRNNAAVRAPARAPAPRGLRPSGQPRAAAPRAQKPRKVVPAPPENAGPKTTSVIVLSDSDDEIEMIFTEKVASETEATKSTPRKDAAQEKRPAVGTEVPVDGRSKGVIPPQIIQRMNQGGISITPVRPPPQQNQNQNPKSNTQLVVVVNETGSHYALALPNGSKLILTPEQVAQIRASNGGKLIL